MHRFLALAVLLALAPLEASAQQVGGIAGTYTNGPATIVFGRDASYVVKGGETVMVSGRYELRSDTLIIIDEGGPFACPGSPGRYLWQRSEAGLGLSLVADPCQGRSAPLTNGVWPGPRSPTLVLRGLTLIDGTGSAPRQNVDVIVGGGRILDVRPAGSGPLPAGAEVRDLTGKWIIPGLVDAHVHLATSPSGEGVETAVASGLRKALLGGITTVRDMAGDGRVLAKLARDAAVGDLAGPDVLYSALFGGPILMTDPRVVMSTRGARPGTLGWCRLVEPDLDWRTVIAEAKGSGASGIKLYGDIPPELLSPIVSEAHAQGLPVWSHAVIFPAMADAAVAAGVDVISHASMLAAMTEKTPRAYAHRFELAYPADAKHPALESLLREMARRGTILEPTLWVFQRGAGGDTLPIARFGAAVTRRAHELGVRILAGTDGMLSDSADALPNLHRELEVLVTQAGLTPMAALVAATGTAARALGLEETTGTIEAGKVANLVVLDADPLMDIRNTRRISFVMKNGELALRE
ncbi:MAG: amidohydrolase family protein [Longimicrobiales bacterium]